MVIVRCAELVSGGTGVAGGGVGDFGEHVSAVEAEHPGGPYDLVAGVGGQGAGDLGDFGVVDWAEQLVGRLEFPACGDVAVICPELSGQLIYG